jgi:hypothetical protein
MMIMKDTETRQNDIKGRKADDPTNEGGGFSGPSRRLDKKGCAKLLSDSTSCFSIRKIGHGSARITSMPGVASRVIGV